MLYCHILPSNSIDLQKCAYFLCQLENQEVLIVNSNCSPSSIHEIWTSLRRIEMFARRFPSIDLPKYYLYQAIATICALHYLKCVKLNSQHFTVLQTTVYGSQSINTENQHNFNESVPNFLKLHRMLVYSFCGLRWSITDVEVLCQINFGHYNPTVASLSCLVIERRPFSCRITFFFKYRYSICKIKRI